MITQFKSRESIRIKNIYEVAEGLTGVKKERWIKLSLGNATGSDRLLISNLFIDAKFKLREIYKKLSYYNSEINHSKKRIEIGLTKESLDQHEKYIQCLDDAVKEIHTELKLYGNCLLNALIPLLNAFFTDDEVIQLVGGSVKAAVEIKSTMDKLELKNKQEFVFNYIYCHGEYRWQKGRAKDFIDCERWEMPLFHCISDYILHEIENNPKLKQATDKKMEELFGDSMVYATYDNDGNIVSTEKVIQDIKVKDLLLKFKDMQAMGIVSRIKKEDVLDIDVEYKLRRLGDDFYQVEDKDGNSLGKVIKK